MGLDLSFGTCFGVEIWEDIIEETGEFKEHKRVRYNQITGEKIISKFKSRIYIFRVDFLDWKEGEEVTDFWPYDEFYSKLKKLDKNFIVNRHCVGIKSFDGKEPYISPQDCCFELISTVEEAKKRWEELFPHISGKNIVYLHASY